MATSVPQGLRLGLVEPRDAAAAFDQRGLLQPSFRWQDVFQEEHARAFAVAGVQRLDVLKVFQEEIDAAIAAGTDLRAFRKSVVPRLVDKGFWGDVEIQDAATGEARTTRFDNRRLQLIFDVNTRQSFAAGTWHRIERNKARKPFVMYRTMRDERVRASHRSWDGLVLPVESPFWQTHYPPNGWRCRCTAFAVDEKDIARYGAAGFPIKREEPAIDWLPYVNPRTGEVVPVPRGIDPGFAYNPAKARDGALHEQAVRKAAQAQPIAGAVAVAQASTANPAMVQQATARFSEFVTATLAAKAATRSAMYVGAIRPSAVRAIEAAGIQLDSAALAVTDDGVRHAMRPQKVSDGVALDPEVYKRMPELIAQRATAMLQELATATLLYVIDIQLEGQVAKLVIQLDKPVKLRTSQEGDRRNFRANLVRTATVMDPLALRDQVRYRVLWGAI